MIDAGLARLLGRKPKQSETEKKFLMAIAIGRELTQEYKRLRSQRGIVSNADLKSARIKIREMRRLMEIN